MRLLGALMVIPGLVAPAGSASHTVTILAARDATLIEDPAGALANGAGPLFVGRTNQDENSRRRAVIQFDLRDALPPRAIVESVELTLHAQPSNLQGAIALHMILADWSEGPTFGGGGGGRPAQPGDVTWIHRTFPFDPWVHPGAQYVAQVSAARPIVGPGPLTFADSRHMLEDVRLWQHAPSRNFGWILIGDEATRQNSTSVASREEPDIEMRPHLTIRYRLPGLW